MGKVSKHVKGNRALRKGEERVLLAQEHPAEEGEARKNTRKSQRGRGGSRATTCVSRGFWEQNWGRGGET